MAPSTSWRNLVPGLIAVVLLASLVVGVVMFAGIGRMRGDTMRLYVLTDQARGVMSGTEVWIAGQKIGVVDGVTFRAPTDDSLGRVVVAIRVRSRDGYQIRRDSRAQVRSGANIIGPVVVYLSTGSPTSPAIQEGDTIRARAQSDLEVAGTKLRAASEQLGPIMTDARTVLANVRSPNGTAGAFLTEGVGTGVGRLRAQVSRLRARLGNSGGAGRAGMQTVVERARMAMARADSIRALVASTNTSFGRFRRDSSLARDVAAIRDELTGLREQLAAPDGTLARASSDSALTRSVTLARQEMAELFADIRRRPMRYVSF